jgi:hypothetical protein
VKSDLGEHGVKLQIWELFGFPKGPLYLHITNERDETEYAFKISRQWTYTLRKQQPTLPKTKPAKGTQRAADAPKVVDIPSVAVQNQRPREEPPNPQRTVTVWYETQTVNLRVAADTRKSDLIEKAVESMGLQRGSYTMEVRDRKGALHTEYTVGEGWSYRIHRMSPPGTQEGADQELRKRGNEARPVLNHSSTTAWTEDESRVANRPPPWVKEGFYRAQRPARPNDLVWIKLQLEDGPCIEHQVKCALTEPDLKLIMWEKLGRPEGPLYLHIRNADDEVEFEFRIAPQWKYTLRKQPRKVNDEDKDSRSAVRKMREARIIEDKSGAGASGTAAQGTKNGKSRTEARTAAPGTGRASRTTAGLSPRLG